MNLGIFYMPELWRIFNFVTLFINQAIGIFCFNYSIWRLIFILLLIYSRKVYENFLTRSEKTDKQPYDAA